MRTTITLDDDVSAALTQRRQEGNRGLSEVVNELIRAGLAATPERRRFRQKTRPIGIRIDVSNVAEALERLDAEHP